MIPSVVSNGSASLLVHLSLIVDAIKIVFLAGLGIHLSLRILKKGSKKII